MEEGETLKYRTSRCEYTYVDRDRKERLRGERGMYMCRERTKIYVHEQNKERETERRGWRARNCIQLRNSVCPWHSPG